MSKIKSLPGQRLCSSLPPDRIPWETSDAIPRNGHRKVAPQPRALKALELALHIHTAGYMSEVCPATRSIKIFIPFSCTF